jgi:WD40 repeat protein
MQMLTIGQGKPRNLAYTANGRLLVALDSWGTLHFWDTTFYAEQLTVPVPPAWSDPWLAFSADGRHALLGGRAWDFGPLLDQARGEGRPGAAESLFSRPPALDVHCLAFTPDGTAVARCTRRPPVIGAVPLLSELELWELNNQRRAEMPSPGYINRNLLQPLAFAPDGRRVAATQVNYSVRVWDTATGDEVEQLEHSDKVQAVVFAPHGRLLATAAEGTLRLWDSKTWTCRKEWKPFPGDAKALAFDPRGKLLLAGGDDVTVRLWSFPGCRKKAELDWEIGAIVAVAFAPDGKTAAAIGEKPAVVVWDVDL